MSDAPTFGVEIEAKVDGYSYNDICDHLACAGIECRNNGYSHRDYHDGVTWKIVSDATVGDDDDDYDEDEGECQIWGDERRDFNCEANDFPCDYGECTECEHWYAYERTHENVGFELVSPVLHVDEEGFEQIRKVCRVLHRIGAYVDEDCGLHVHHGVGEVTEKQIKSIVKIFAKYEDALDMLVDEDRGGEHGSEYARGLKLEAKNHARYVGLERYDYATNSYIKPKNSGKVLEDITSGDDDRVIAGIFFLTDHAPGWYEERYMKVNMQNATRDRETVEVRMHEGCIDAKEIIGWTTLTSRLVQYALQPRRPRKTVGTFSGLLRVTGYKKAESWMRVAA